jgi:hypothetical protein
MLMYDKISVLSSQICAKYPKYFVEHATFRTFVTSNKQSNNKLR